MPLTLHVWQLACACACCALKNACVAALRHGPVGYTSPVELRPQRGLHAYSAILRAQHVSFGQVPQLVWPLDGAAAARQIGGDGGGDGEGGGGGGDEGGGGERLTQYPCDLPPPAAT
jgi:uncharacterized membrane protein YgcG